MAACVSSAGAKQIITGLLSPTQLPGLQVWLDGADPLGTGTAPANNTVISTWADKSGNARNATGVASPPYVSASRNISFNGSSQYFTIPYSGSHQTETGFFVITYANTNSQIVLVGNVTSTRQIVNVAPQVGVSGVSNNASATNPTANTLCIAGYSFNPALSFAYLNGTAGSAGTGMSPGAESFLYLGCSSTIGTFVNGSISEVIIYNQFLSTVQRQAVEGYLAWKWNLMSSLPVGHPYIVTAAVPTSISTRFFPTYMPGIQLWLDGSDPLGTGTAPANNTVISTWADKSGNARNATSVGSPVFNTSSNAIVLNGTSQAFSMTYSGVHATETAFIVVNMTTPNSFAFFISSPITYARQFYDYNTALAFGQTNIGGNATNSSTLTAGSNTLLGYSLNSTNSFLYFNGTSGPTGTGFGSLPSETTIYVGYSGSGQYLAGTISEVIIYNQVLTTAERQVVEGYLAWKWGTQASLPATHPYKTVQPSSLTFVPSYTNTSNIAANADSYLPLMSNTFDIGNTPQLVGSNGTLSFSNVLGKNCIYINNNTANFVSLPMANINVFTIAFWFNYTSTSYFTAASYTTAAGAMAIQFDLVAAGSNTAYTALPNQWTISPSSSNLGVNTWNFMTLTINQNTFVGNLYMNGVLAASATGSGVFPSSPNLMVLGKSGDQTVAGGTRSYQGFLQNFMYFNTVLTAAQVASIYEQTALDLAIASQPTSLSLTFSTPNLSFSWVAGTNTTSYVVAFYGISTNTTVGGVLLATYTITSTSQTYAPSGYAFVYATVTPTNSGFLGTPATSSAVSLLPSAATGVTMGSFAAQQTTISASWTAGAGATSYTVNFLSNAANSTSGGTVWQTFTGVTGTSQTSSSTLISGSNGTYYYATVTSVNSAGSSSAATSSGNIQYYIPKWVPGITLWLDGADPLATGTPPSVGASVLYWYDKSGYGIHYASAGAVTPTYNTDSTYARNGMYFSNTNNLSNAYSQSNVNTSPFAATTQFSIITVHRCINSTNIQDIWRNYNFTPNNDWVRWWPGNGWSMYLGGRLSNISTSSNNNYNGINIAVSQSSAVNLYVNGSSNISGTRSNATAQTATTSIVIGGTGPGAPGECIYGYIFEVMVVNTNLSTANRQILEGYPAWKWGRQSLLVAGHPYLSASP